MTGIVVGWTPDEYGAVAVEHAAAEAALAGSSVILVNGSKGDAYVDQRWASPEQLDEVRADLEGRGVTVEVRQVVAQDVGQAVLTVAREVDATLVVLGIRRRSPVGKLLMGSVAQRVLLDAECPVLAVKPGSRPRVARH
ncbi:universal stress protein [Nocardioides psychrotolerans]|uniref:universal stress protein n=1 Tax=Nocardioides psychrotolerans TaxID=1005945 RepID=UPI003137D576